MPLLLNPGVSPSRSINTTSPLTGGGDLTADRTIAVSGLSSLGAANQIVGSNSGATALEYKTLSGTTNQITVTNSLASVVLATPQNIDTGASPTFAGMTLTSLTSGSVPFIGTGGIFSQNNANFFWDNTNAGLGVGVGSGLLEALHVRRSSAGAVRLLIENSAAAGNNDAGLRLRSPGTTNDVYVFKNSTSNTSWAGAGGLSFLNTDSGTIAFFTNNTATRRLVIDAAGNVGVQSGASALGASLHIGTGTVPTGTPAMFISNVNGQLGWSVRNATFANRDCDFSIWSDGHCYWTFTNRVGDTGAISMILLTQAVAGGTNPNITLRSASYTSFDTNGATEAMRIDATQRVGIGVSTSISALLHVAASSTARAQVRLNAGTAPTTPGEGDIWNDSTQKANISYVDGVKQTLEGTLYTSTATGTVSNTTVETTVVGTGIGTQTIPANFLVPGKTIRITARGVYSTQAAPVALTMRIKLGSTNVSFTAANTPSASMSNRTWRIVGILTCRTTGAAGTVFGQSAFEHMATAGATGSPTWWEMSNTAATTVDTTVSQVVDLTAQWAAGVGAADSISGTNVSIESLN